MPKPISNLFSTLFLSNVTRNNCLNDINTLDAMGLGLHPEMPTAKRFGIPAATAFGVLTTMSRACARPSSGGRAASPSTLNL